MFENFVYSSIAIIGDRNDCLVISVVYTNVIEHSKIIHYVIMFMNVLNAN